MNASSVALEHTQQDQKEIHGYNFEEQNDNGVSLYNLKSYLYYN